MLLFEPPFPSSSDSSASLFLHQLSAQNLIDRLNLVKRTFKKALVMGKGAQLLVDHLTSQYCAVFSHHPYKDAQQIQFYEESFPFTWPSFDLICCNLNLHWTNDLPGVLLQIRHLLYPDGLFLGSFLGQDTLKELKESFLQVETQQRFGAGVHVGPFIDLATASQLIQRCGLSLPVVDHDQQKVTYLSPVNLMRDLKLMGETSRSVHRLKALYSPHIMRSVIAFYQKHFSQNGRVIATYDFCYLTGWAPSQNQQRSLKPGTATHLLTDFLSPS